MKRFGITLALLVSAWCFAQTAATITITIPSDIAADLAHAHAAQRKAVQEQAKKLARKLDEDIDPSTVHRMLQADIATAIADKVARYSPSDLPSRRSGESDTDLRNRYQEQIRSKITVR